MKIIKILIPIVLFSIFVSCKNNKDSLTMNDWFNLYRLQNQGNSITLSGRAMKGRLKSATIKVIPVSSDGKCDKDSTRILGTSLTNEKGDYIVTYPRSGAPICLFVVPETKGTSKMYDEFSKTDLDWTGESYLVSIMNEPPTTQKKKSGLAITPLTRFAAGRLAALAEANSDSSSISELVTKSNKEVARRFGIRNSIFSTRVSNFFSRAETVEDAPEISEVEIDFDNPNDSNAVTQKAILGGISVLANQTKSISGYSTQDVDEVLDTFSKYIASGRNDGKDSSGNILIIPGSDVPIGNNALSSTLNSAIGTYIQSGGAAEIGVTVTEINNNISLVDKIEDTSGTVVLDTTPPQIVSYSPANGATGVMPGATISITFDELIDTSTTSLNAQSTDGTCRGTIQVSTDEFVNCIGMTIDATANPAITLTPVTSLQGNSTYKIRVTTGLVDVAINPIALTTSTGFSTVDLIQPVVSSVTSTTVNGSYQNADTINVRLNFNVPVLVTGTPRILLNTTPATYANYASGSGTSILDFTYTVGSTENSGDLDYASTSGLELNGGTMTNTNTLVNASLTLPSPGGAGSLGANKNIIVDNTLPIINFAAASSSNLESVASPTIAVNLSKAFYLTTTINYTVTGGTATGSGTDYALTNGTLTFNPSITSQNITLAVTDDTIDELNETIIITLSTPSNGTLGTITTHTNTITDNDGSPTVAFTSSTSSNAESVTTANISVDLSSVSGNTVTVDYAVAGGTATGGGVDYTLTTGTLTFSPGITSQNISLAINNDAVDEDDKTVAITLSLPTNATLGVNTIHTYTITDDDLAPTISFLSASSASANEASTVSTLDLNLSTASGKIISVVVTDAGGTATSGADYTALGSPITITFNPGETSKTINIPVIQDMFAEGDETILLSLGSYSNVSSGVNISHTFTITDDDFSITAANTMDCNGNGKIDHYKLTFGSNLTDSSFPGYNANGLGSPTGAWLVSGYANVRIHHGTALSGVCASETDTIDDAIIYLAFDEGAGFDTGAKPDLTTTTSMGLTGASGTAAQIFTGTLTEADGAQPVVIGITPANTTSNVPVSSFVATADFSEDMNTGTFNGTNFTLTGIGGVAGTVATIDNNTTTFTATVNLDYNQSHTLSLSNMADINGQVMSGFSSTFTTSQKNKIAGTIANGGAGVTVTLTVNGGGPNNFNGTTSFTTTNLLGIGDTYSTFISAMPPGKICALVSTPSNPAGGIFSGTTDLAIDVNCVNGYSVGGTGIQTIPLAENPISLYQGNISSFVGSNTSGATDGNGSSASFNAPYGITFDSQNFYIADWLNNRIRKIDTAGNVTTIAGNGNLGNTDGSGNISSLAAPRSIATDGTYLYVGEFGASGGNRIKRIRISNNYVETLAGDNSAVSPAGASLDGIGTAAKFNEITGLAIENNILYIAERSANKIRKLDLSTLEVTTLSSGGSLNTPENIAIVSGFLYVTNVGSHNILKIDKTNGSQSIFAGNPSGIFGFADAVGTSAYFYYPHGITTDGKNLFIGDQGNHRIRQIEIATQKVSTIAGNGLQTNLDGVGISASFNTPSYVFSNGKSLYVTLLHGIKKITNNGLVAYYPLNGSANDYVGNGNGTITGATSTTGRFGEANGAYSFSGTSLDKIDIPHSASIALGSGDFSIALWVNPNTTQSDTTFPDNELVSDWDGVGGYNYAIRYHNTSGNVNGYFSQGHILFARFDGSTVSPCYSGISIPANQFHHILAQKIGTKLKLYIDGKVVCAVNDSIGIISKTAFKTIGYRAGGSNKFSGKISDVRFYNRALTEGEANELAQNASPTYSTGATGLLTNFHLDNGSNNSRGAIPDLGLTGSTGSNSSGKDGEPNGARTFDGATHYLSTNTPYGIPSGKAARTICSWIKLDSFPAPSTWYAIATQGSAASYQVFGIGIWNNNPNMQVIIPTWTTDYFFNLQISLNTWTHICATYDGTNVTAFANGVQLGAPQAASTINTGTSLFRIGALIDGGASNKFKGNLDDVRVYNNTLTATQIRQLAAQVPDALVARYDFIGDLNDMSGFGNTLSPTALSPTPNKWGVANTAYLFNGSGFAAGANPATDTVENLTLTAWIKPTQYNPSLHTVLVNGNPSSTGYGIQIDGTNGTVRGILGNVTALATNAKVPLHVWSHVAIRRNSGNWNIFLNGANIPITSGVTGSTPIIPNALRVGAHPDGSEKFIGNITDVRIYVKPLTDSEIIGLSGSHPMQVAGWSATPASSNLKLYLQADSLSNLTNATPVGGWNDDSGNLFNLTQATPADRPSYVTNGINGKPSVNFTGSANTNLNGACNPVFNSSANTIFGVINQANTGGGFRGVFHHGNKLVYFNGTPDESLSLFHEGNANQKVGSQNGFISLLTANPNMMFSINHNGTTGILLKNGTNVTNIVSSASAYSCASNLMLGRTNWNPNENVFNGLIGDFLYFNTALSSQDQDLVECYLSSKYNIPVGHPCP